MGEEIIKTLVNAKKALNFEEIARRMELEDDDLELLQENVDDLLTSYDIYKTKEDKFIPINESPIKKGVYRVSRDGNGRIQIGDKVFYIDHENSGEAVDGDIVLFEPMLSPTSRKYEGNVLMVLGRCLDEVMGEVHNVNGEAFLRLDNYRLDKLNIKLDNCDLVSGTKVIVKLKKNDSINDYDGIVVKNIGYKNDPGVDIETVAYRYKFFKDFPKDVMDELESIPSKVLESDLEGRLDLRDLNIFTIDGSDTKDIDDAISYQKLPNGNDLVGIHIADVTHYVKENTALDKEAYLRGTSGYFASTVIPMLPQKLSNGICSLNPNEDRCAMSIFAELDSDGNIVNSFITPSVIRSRKQMTYEDVNKLFYGKEVPGYEDYKDDLNNLLKVSETQINKRESNGALSLEDKELKVYLDEAGKPIDFKVKKNDKAEDLIESLMLVANQVAPMKLVELDAPCIYRIHENPSMERIQKYMRLYNILGYNYDHELDTTNMAIQHLLKDAQTKEDKDILQRYFLRALMKAQYSPINMGHCGLGMEYYSQFTSPIRRYPDDILHRLIKEYVMSGQKYEDEKSAWLNKLHEVYPSITYFDGSVREEPTKERTLEWEERLPNMALHTSNRERMEDACEKDVLHMKEAENMKEHIGESYPGMITEVNNKYMVVELDNMFEGIIPVEDLNGYYRYNEKHYALEDAMTGEAYHVGDKLLCKVIDVNKDKGYIYLYLDKVLSIVNGPPVELLNDHYQERKEKYNKKVLKKKSKRG